LLLAANPLPMWVYDLGTLRFVEVNDAAIAHYGYSRAAFLAMTIADIRPMEDIERLRAIVAARRESLQFSGAWRHRRADGAVIDVEVTSHLLDWEGRPAVLVGAHDVTETRRLQEELARRTLLDEATGLANAALFADRAGAALDRSRQSGAHVGVLVVGLSALEGVASTLGDEAAAALVEATAQRLRSCCGGPDTLGRLGGGRFAVVREAASEVAILSFADQVAVLVEQPVAVTGWGHEDDLHRSREVGLDLHLVKPVTAKDMRAMLVEIQPKLEERTLPLPIADLARSWSPG
jgi:PAS domain S-box-containing protein